MTIKIGIVNESNLEHEAIDIYVFGERLGEGAPCYQVYPGREAQFLPSGRILTMVIKPSKAELGLPARPKRDAEGYELRPSVSIQWVRVYGQPSEGG